jgi:hypothetical protein
MNNTLPRTDTRTRLEDTPRIMLMSRGQIYYRQVRPITENLNWSGEIVKLMSRGVAYRKRVAHKIYQKPSAINWRWGEALN